jgi:hypothetical protein
MYKKPEPKNARAKKNILIKRFIDARYITLTGKYDPLINRILKQILSRSS